MISRAPSRDPSILRCFYNYIQYNQAGDIMFCIYFSNFLRAALLISAGVAGCGQCRTYVERTQQFVVEDRGTSSCLLLVVAIHFDCRLFHRAPTLSPSSRQHVGGGDLSRRRVHSSDGPAAPHGGDEHPQQLRPTKRSTGATHRHPHGSRQRGKY